MSEKQQVIAKVDADAYEAAKKRLEHGGISREIRKTIEAIAYGETASEVEQVKQRLEEEREERSKLRAERADIDRKLENKDRVIERLESRLDNLRDKKGEYEGALQMIERDMRENEMHVYPGHGSVQEAAELGDCSVEDVIEDLKDRADDLSEERFEKAGPAHDY